MSGEPGVVSFISRSCPRLRHLCQNLGTNEPLHSTQLHKYKYTNTNKILEHCHILICTYHCDTGCSTVWIKTPQYTPLNLWAGQNTQNRDKQDQQVFWQKHIIRKKLCNCSSVVLFYLHLHLLAAQHLFNGWMNVPLEEGAKICLVKVHKKYIHTWPFKCIFDKFNFVTGAIRFWLNVQKKWKVLHQC